MKVWYLLPAVVLCGCAARREPTSVAYRGPDVTIQMRPASGRAERMAKTVAAPPIAIPTPPPPTAPDVDEAKKSEEAPKPKPHRRHPRHVEEPTPKAPPVEKPKPKDEDEDRLPPDETFLPGGHKSHDPDPDTLTDPNWDEKRHDDKKKGDD